MDFMAWYREAEKVQKLVEEEGWVDETEMWGADLDPEVVLRLMQVPVPVSPGRQQASHVNDSDNSKSHEQDLLSAGSERAQDIYLMAKAAQKYSGTKEPLALILRICCILTVNCLTLTDAVLEPVGIALDPLAALLNHSCEPSCVIRFDILGSISVDVLRPISSGEELTISYIDNTQPLNYRQADLTSRYFFKCTCPRCSRGTNTPFDRILTQVESAEAREAKAYATDATLQSGLLVYRIDPILYPEPHHPVRIVNKWRLYRLAQHILFFLQHTFPPYPSSTTSSILGNPEDEAKLLQTTLRDSTRMQDQLASQWNKLIDRALEAELS
ncbi:hypothetical protein DV738_g4338, partial [Chaetothyriales sp. CBS 135597]